MHQPEQAQFSEAVAVKEPAARRSFVGETLARPLRADTIWGLLLVYLGATQLCLWRFLDVFPLWIYLVAASAIIAIAAITMRQIRAQPQLDADSPTVATFAICLAFSLLLLALGGEGRFFYANIDWQVRYAVLRDMAINPWPFAYAAPGQLALLRAPIGMFFLPALVWKALGPAAADWALLVQNGFLLAAMLSLGSRFFATPGQRALALAVITFFSGLDIVGQYATHSFHEHLESWGATQFSSIITQAFWVPHHALPAWLGALAFLQWHRGRWPLAAFLTPLPLLALWSPLALMGLAPFAAFAGVTDLRRRSIDLTAIILPASACLLAVPSLLYLLSAGSSVGVRPYPIDPDQYWLFEAVEVLPFVFPLFFTESARRYPGLLGLVTLWLLLVPYVKIGPSSDFAMRASIPALAILAFLVAEQLLRKPRPALPEAALIVALSLGAFTGLAEIARAFRHPPAPALHCPLYRAYDESFGPQSKATYVAPVGQMPALVRPHSPFPVNVSEPTPCWLGDWYRPSGT